MKKQFYLLIIFLYLLLVSGCSSIRELDKRALVSAMAIDKLKVNGQDYYRTTVEVFKPGEMAGVGKEGSSVKPQPYLIVSAVGKNLFEARRNLDLKLSRNLFFAHSDIIIIGEKLAREDDITKVFDMLIRDQQFRLRAYIYIAKGEAAKIFTTHTDIEHTLAEEISRFTDKLPQTESKAYVATIREFVILLLSKTDDPVTGRIEIVSSKESFGGNEVKSNLNLTGAAVFSDKKLAGWLNAEESRGLLFIINRAGNGIIPVKLPGKSGGNFSFEVFRESTSIVPAIDKDRVSITLKVKVAGDIGDVEDGILISDPKELIKLEKSVSAEVKRIIKKSVQKSKLLRADIFGFADTVHKKYPRRWKMVEGKWRQNYAGLPVKVEVETKIRGSGMISDPLK